MSTLALAALPTLVVAAHATPPSSTVQSQHAASGDAVLDVTTTIDRIDLSVADRATVTFTCSTRPSAILTLPEVGTELGGFTVASSTSLDHIDPTPPFHRTTILTLVLEPFLAGDKTLPSFTFAAVDTGRTLKLATEAVVLHVRSVADDKADARTPLEPARTPVALVVPSTQSHVVIWIVLLGSGIAIGSAFAFAATSAARKRRREADPLNRVRRELAALQSTLAVAGTRADAAIAAERLFRAVGEYLSTVHHIPATSNTLSSITPHIAATDRFSTDQRSELVSLLAELERVRFAPDAISVPAITTLRDRADAWIARASLQGAAA